MSDDVGQERRKGERRKAFILLPWEQGLAWIDRHLYTGEFLVIISHAHQGDPRYIQIPNPAGYES